MLRLEGVDYSYGRVRALRGVSLEVGAQESVCLLGMNGAGKSTLLSCISGLLRPQAGRIMLNGTDLVGLKPSAVVKAGVVQVPEGRQVFAPLTVRENLELGAYVPTRQGRGAEVAQTLSEVLELFPVLGQRLEQAAGTLSGGEQQMLAIARGLMARPSLMLLDEPSLGLAPKIAAEIFTVLHDLPSQGTSVLLVEQNALGALSITQRGYVITGGAIRVQGACEDILSDSQLREAFLGPERATRIETTPPGGRQS